MPPSGYHVLGADLNCSKSACGGLRGDELRLIRALIRANGEHSRYLFLSERKGPMSIDGAQKLIERLGETAKFPFQIHVHMEPLKKSTLRCTGICGASVGDTYATADA